MPVVALKPIRHLDEFTASVAKPIAAYFTEAVFGPLLAYLRENGVKPNPADQAIGHANKDPGSAVKRALLTGAIWYADGVFSGKFNATISRELRAMGAKFSNPVFRIAETDLPLDIRGYVVYSAQQSAQLHQGVLNLIDEMQANAPKAPLGIDTGPQVEKIVENLDKQFEETVPKLAGEEAPTAPVPMVSQRENDILQIQIHEPIRNFTSEQLADLRARVQANAVTNGRADKLAKIIETRYGVSKRKATFLAEQESSLLVSRYRERRYKSIGIQRYKWSTSHDERVRKDHRLLNGTVHDWSNPPVTNRKTGARNHPGCDFGCRCASVPLRRITDPK